MSWLTQLIDSTSELESPRSFWYWSGISAISAVVKDNIFLNRGGLYKLYPNLYVMLYARSGLRKGPPINFAKELVRSVNNTRIISGRSSIQGILKKLGEAYSVPGGKVINKSTAFIVASELSSSIVEDKAANSILTDLYDRYYNKGEWESLLKMETFTLKDPTISMLGGINEAHFTSMMTNADLHGGFIGRNCLIVETQINTVNSLIDDLSNPPNTDKFVPHLKEINNINGQFKSLSGTRPGKHFDEWYRLLRKELDKNEIEDKTGTIERIGDTVLKIAMLLSLSEGLELIITDDQLDEAIEAGERLIGNMRKTTIMKDELPDGEIKLIIMKELLDRPEHIISRKILLKKYWMVMNAEKLNELMPTMEEVDIVVCEMHGNQLMYRMPDAAVKKLDDYFKNRKGGKSK